MLSAAKKKKQHESGDPTAVLWYQEIQNTVNAANVHAFDAAKST